MSWNLTEPLLVCRLIQKKMELKTWADLKYYLGASLSALSCIIWQSSDSTVLLVISDTAGFPPGKCWLGAGDRPLRKKKKKQPLFYMLCMERKSLWCPHHVQGGIKGMQGLYTEKPDKKWKSPILHRTWYKMVILWKMVQKCNSSGFFRELVTQKPVWFCSAEEKQYLADKIAPSTGDD